MVHLHSCMHGTPITGPGVTVPARALGLDHIRLSSLKHLDGLVASIFYCYILCLDGIHFFHFLLFVLKKH
jgi:energy-converting hydrogenase Eha subunit A